ncbi:hypothetical protein [Streptomyces collinus]|uniref:hypothetical protein n=1 Tax=Streptomyces collinus TaxID=42684 RepID=UPI00294372E6|nr:hypothetical protein [Streptomyces collinus]
MAEVDVVSLFAVGQPCVRSLAGREAFHEGVGGGDRGAGLLALVVEGVGTGGDGGRQRRGGRRPMPGGVAAPFGKVGRSFAGAVVERDHGLPGEHPGVQLGIA